MTTHNTERLTDKLPIRVDDAMHEKAWERYKESGQRQVKADMYIHVIELAVANPDACAKAIGEVIQSAKLEDEPSKGISINISPELNQALKDLAARFVASKRWVVRWATEAWISGALK